MDTNQQIAARLERIAYHFQEEIGAYTADLMKASRRLRLLPELIITEEHFRVAVGRAPQQDDLVRCNCKRTGQPGHYFCGWDEVRNLPRFMVGAEDAEKS